MINKLIPLHLQEAYANDELIAARRLEATLQPQRLRTISDASKETLPPSPNPSSIEDKDERGLLLEVLDRQRSLDAKVCRLYDAGILRGRVLQLLCLSQTEVLNRHLELRQQVGGEKVNAITHEAMRLLTVATRLSNDQDLATLIPFRTVENMVVFCKSGPLMRKMGTLLAMSFPFSENYMAVVLEQLTHPSIRPKVYWRGTMQ